MGVDGREDREEASRPTLVRHLDVAQVGLSGICIIFFIVFSPYSFFSKVTDSLFGVFIVRFTPAKIFVKKKIHTLIFFSVLLLIRDHLGEYLWCCPPFVS